MRRLVLLATALAALAAAPAASAGTLSLQPVGTFTAPDYVTSMPGDSSRLLVVQQNGLILQVRDGVSTTFLDLRSRIGSTTGERGLLSLAFDPDHPDTFYVDYASSAGGGSISIVRFQVDTAGAVTSTAGDIVLTIPHSADRHNGGQLAFGPADGLLYVSVGDNTDAASAQDATVGTGKILRLDPAAANSVASAVWADGLRNPWRFSFTPEGSLVVADVGEVAWEEIDTVAASDLATSAGPNYGWPCKEGLHDAPPSFSSSTAACGAGASSFTAPAFDYAHVAGGMCGGAVTGGYVVRDSALPSLLGRYVFGDYCKGWIKSVALGSAEAPRAEALTVSKLSSFGEDADGHLYTVSSAGTVSRVIETPDPSPVAAAPAAPAVPPASAAQPAVRDAVAPVLALATALRQRVLRDRLLDLRARCSETCRVRARASIHIAGRKRALTLGLRSAAAAAGHSAKLAWTVPAPVRRSMARALRAHRRVRATFTLTGADAAGNRSRTRSSSSAIVG